MSPTEDAETDRPHPLNVLAKLAQEEGWDFERDNPNEMITTVAGEHAAYLTSFTWEPETEVLHLACSFELNPTDNRVGEIQRLVLKINAALWVGHLEFWVNDGRVFFRFGTFLSKGAMFTEAQFSVLFNEALMVCDQYYHAFQWVAWKGLGAEEAFQAAALEPPEGTLKS